VYTAKFGETLWAIMQANGLPAEAIKNVVSESRLEHLTIDNVSLHKGKVVHMPDGIPGDVMRAGDKLVVGYRQWSVPYTHVNYVEMQRISPLFIAAAGVSLLGALYGRRCESDPIGRAVDLYLGRYDTKRLVSDLSVSAVCATAGISKKNLYEALAQKGYKKRSVYYSLVREALKAEVSTLSATKSAAEIASMLKISRSTVYRYKAQGIYTEQQRLAA
jgi:predicted DNA-binding transcriptional regulator AlpA